MNRPDHVKAFPKTLEHFRYEHQIYDVFRDWTKLAAAELHQAPYHAGLPKVEAFARVEAEYLAVAKKYQREDFDRFAELLAITGMALSKGKQDFVGQCYMQLEISNARAGQFFTLHAVSLLFVRLTVGNLLLGKLALLHPGPPFWYQILALALDQFMGARAVRNPSQTMA